MSRVGNIRDNSKRATLLLACFVSLTGLAQGHPKHKLGVQDYKQWYTLRTGEVSSNGEWMSYRVEYKEAADSVYIKNNSSGAAHVLAFIRNGSFFQDKWFAFLTRENHLCLLNLKTGGVNNLGEAKTYWIAPGFIIVASDGRNGTTVKVFDAGLGTALKLENIVSYAKSPDGSRIAYATTEGRLAVAQLRKSRAKTTDVSKWQGSTYKGLAWDSSGKFLYFLRHSSTAQGREAELSLFDTDQHKLYKLDGRLTAETGGSFAPDENDTRVTVSPDGKRVVFKINVNQQKPASGTGASVEIWNAADKVVYPKKIENAVRDRSMTAVWYPVKGRWSTITTAELPQVTFNSNAGYGLLYNELAYAPFTTFSGMADYYAVDFESGQKQLFLKKYPAGHGNLFHSPCGKFVAYHKEGNWYLYDLKHNKHRNLTGEMKHNFAAEQHDTPEAPFMFGLAGWSSDGPSVFLYDEYDIWQFNSDGVAQRLTDGRETGRRYRIPQRAFAPGLASIFKVIDTGALVISFQSINDTIQGLSLFSKGKIKDLASGDFHFQLQNISKNPICIYYTKERFDIPPVLMQYNLRKGTHAIIFSSNPQHFDFEFGSSQILTYKRTNGEVAKGIMFCPPGYSPNGNYPMIVSVYEKQFQKRNRYINPSLEDEIGFNIPHYLSQGYFVLLPDLYYRVGEPGQSASESIITAVEQAVQLYPIDKGSVGLIGHSFGGYESLFTITQTNMFAAAVVGAPYTDFISSYFNVGRNRKMPDFWRFEEQQLRMGKPFFEDRWAYLQNSPIMRADNITTPLLQWSGKEDYQVIWNQSVAFHLAMRRLGKESILLLYPDEPHALLTQENKIDLNIRIQQWFDYYLKQHEKQAWMASDYVQP